MKTLIVIREKDCQWARAFFPDMHPFLLTICNKPYVEFLVDFSLLSGIRQIRLLSDGPLGEVEEYCENGSRWGAEISYASIQSGDDMQTVLAKNKRFCAEERCMIINGMVFINYGKQADYNAFIAAFPSGEILSCSCGSLMLTGNPSGTRNISPPYPFTLSCFDSPGLYYRLSSDILNDAVSPYVLPGYNNEPLCHIGRNVVIGKSAEIIKPVILGDNVQILGGAVVGPGAIIGSNVIIDRNSSVIHSVVIDHTYIGEQLEVEKKIVSGNMLIEPESGVSLAIEDPHLLTGIRKSRASLSFIQYAVQALAALFILVLLLIPFLFLFPVLKLRGKWMQHNEDCYADISGKILNLSVTAIERGGLFGSIAIFLSLDRFFQLFRVLAGQIAIIGSTPLRVSPENREHLKRMPGYRPGVFSYAEAEAWPVDHDDKAIIERFYTAHSALFQDILMTVKAFVNRIHEKSTP